MNDIAILPDTRWQRPLTLAALIALADLMLWHHAPGLGCVALVLGCGLAAQWHWGPASRTAWLILVLAVLPMVEKVNLLSLLFAWGGLTVFCAALVSPQTLTRTALRIPLFAALQNARDVSALASNPPSLRWRGLRDWIVPVGLGLVFVLLFAGANPVLDRWLTDLVAWDSLLIPDLSRLWFWAMLTPFLWPLLRLRADQAALARPVVQTPQAPLPWLNATSVTRSLILFNLLFALQTLSDLAFLSGGVDLPEGMTYATYAHRGAYPLVVTALLAGGFAILAQPFLAARPALRWLLMVWVAQNILLVLSAVLRLDLYVDAYGLTRMRFAAFVWMGVVTIGLGIMIYQLRARLGVGWMIGRSALVGILALYLSLFVNVDGLIGRVNITGDIRPDNTWYECQLGEGIVPAIVAWEIRTGKTYCYSRGHTGVSTPQNWREWGFRNARLRRSLAQLKGDAS